MNPFAVLGVAEQYGVDLGAAERAYKELVRALHPDRHVDAAPSVRREALSRAVEVNEAWRIMRDPIRRAETLFTLRGIPVGENVEPKPAPAFLMGMMELREELADAKTAKNEPALTALVARVRKENERAASALAAALDSASDPVAAAHNVTTLGELRFYNRFLEEAEAIRDEWENDAA